MRVNVLGGGLSALLAAHAASLYGHRVQLVESPLWYDQPLESLATFRKVPQLNTEPLRIRSLIVGDEVEWYEKAGPLTSDLAVQGEFYGWAGHDLFEELDDRYGWEYLVADKVEDALDADLVINAEATLALCETDDCEFHQQYVSRLPISKFNANVESYIVGSGHSDDWWHTAWSLGGAVGSYVGEGVHRPLADAVRLLVPTQTTCTCHPEVLRVGKTGTWNAKYQSVDAFFDTIAKLQGMS